MQFLTYAQCDCHNILQPWINHHHLGFEAIWPMDSGRIPNNVTTRTGSASFVPTILRAAEADLQKPPDDDDEIETTTDFLANVLQGMPKKPITSYFAFLEIFHRLSDQSVSIQEYSHSEMQVCWAHNLLRELICVEGAHWIKHLNLVIAN